MSDSTVSDQHLLAQAKAGSDEGLGRLLETYKNYLRLLVIAQLEQRLRARVSPSDVIQETFLEVHRDFGQFRGVTMAEFLAWLRRVLINNVYRAAEQHVHAEKRDVRREISLDQLALVMERSAARFGTVLPDPGPSPSGHAQHRETELALADQLAALPDDYRDVIVLRHIKGLPFDDVGRVMGRSSGAARMLWLRAIKQLRSSLNAGER